MAKRRAESDPCLFDPEKALLFIRVPDDRTFYLSPEEYVSLLEQSEGSVCRAVLEGLLGCSPGAYDSIKESRHPDISLDIRSFSDGFANVFITISPTTWASLKNKMLPSGATLASYSDAIARARLVDLTIEGRCINEQEPVTLEDWYSLIAETPDLDLIAVRPPESKEGSEMDFICMQRDSAIQNLNSRRVTAQALRAIGKGEWVYPFPGGSYWVDEASKQAIADPNNRFFELVSLGVQPNPVTLGQSTVAYSVVPLQIRARDRQHFVPSGKFREKIRAEEIQQRPMINITALRERQEARRLEHLEEMEQLAWSRENEARIGRERAEYEARMAANEARLERERAIIMQREIAQRTARVEEAERTGEARLQHLRERQPLRLFQERDLPPASARTLMAQILPFELRQYVGDMGYVLNDEQEFEAELRQARRDNIEDMIAERQRLGRTIVSYVEDVDAYASLILTEREQELIQAVIQGDPIRPAIVAVRDMQLELIAQQEAVLQRPRWVQERRDANALARCPDDDDQIEISLLTLGEEGEEEDVGTACFQRLLLLEEWQRQECGWFEPESNKTARVYRLIMAEQTIWLQSDFVARVFSDRLTRVFSAWQSERTGHVFPLADYANREEYPRASVYF